MAKDTEFAIGAKVSCSDGLCGELTRIVLDTDGRTVTHLVVEPKHRHERSRLVPLDLVETTAEGITLRRTIEEFDQLDPADEVEPVVDPGLGITGVVGLPPAGIPAPVQFVVQDVVPVGDIEVHPGDPVQAVDGEIGQVRGFLVDPDGHVTHIELREGHLWRRKQVAIPVSAVAGTDEAGIRLNLTKKQVEQLPPES
jgi:hypothetical protein